MTLYVLLATALLLSLASPWIHRRIRRHRDEHDRRTAAEHRRLQLVNATDWAISAAARTSQAKPVTDLSDDRQLRVSIADVVDRAAADFNLEIPRAEAAAMLRNRLEFRGHVGWPGLITDAFDNEEDQAP